MVKNNRIIFIKQYHSQKITIIYHSSIKDLSTSTKKVIDTKRSSMIKPLSDAVQLWIKKGKI